MTGVALFAHGSRIESANEAVRLAAGELGRHANIDLVEAAFLELGDPDLAGAVGRLVSHGADKVVVVPYFLTLGTHMQRDLPRIVEEIRSIHTGVPIHVSEPLDGHPGLITALRDRVSEVLDGGSDPEGQAD
jgi:sirohydrochlorin ferrochelatase